MLGHVLEWSRWKCLAKCYPVARFTGELLNDRLYRGLRSNRQVKGERLAANLLGLNVRVGIMLQAYGRGVWTSDEKTELLLMMTKILMCDLVQQRSRS